MDGAVAFEEGRRLRSEELPNGFLQRLRRDPRVEASERTPKPNFQDDVAEERVGALGVRLADRKLRAMCGGPANRGQPFEGGRFYSRLIECCGHRSAPTTIGPQVCGSCGECSGSAPCETRRGRAKSWCGW